MADESHDYGFNPITDPIAASLQATISDEQTAFRQLDKTKSDSVFDIKTLEIWAGPKGARILNHECGLLPGLPEKLFETANAAALPGEVLMTRMLVTRPALAGSQIACYDDLGKPGSKQINHLPFVPKAMDELLHRWDLPKSWPWLRLNSREVGNFSRTTEWDHSVNPPRALRIGLVIHFPFVLRPARQLNFLLEARGYKTASRRKNNTDYSPWRDDPHIWSFAMSHSLRDGKSRGLLDGITDWAFADITNRMLREGSRSSYQHPLHLPCILLSVFVDHVAWEINRVAIDVADFEQISKGPEKASLDRFEALTTQLQCLHRNLDFQQSLVDFLKETMQFVNENGPPRYPGSERLSTFGSFAYLREANPAIEEKLTNAFFLLKNNMSTCKYLQTRTKDAMEYVNTTISLRANESHQAGVHGTQALSLLHMTFLPGTAVAAIFSANVFNWGAQAPGIVRPAFYVFCICVVVVTVLVLGVYFYVRRRGRPRIQRLAASEAATLSSSDKLGREQVLIYRDPASDGGRLMMMKKGDKGQSPRSGDAQRKRASRAVAAADVARNSVGSDKGKEKEKEKEKRKEKGEQEPDSPGRELPKYSYSKEAFEMA